MKLADIEGRLARSRLTKPAPFPGAGLLTLRVAVGLIFMVHGIDKLGDLSGTEEFFASIDIPAPALAAPFVAVVETLGGALLIVGLATPLAAAALTVNMLVALATAHVDTGFAFFASRGGIELELLLAGCTAAIVLVGAGQLSVDAVLGRSRRLSHLRGALEPRGATALDAEGASR